MYTINSSENLRIDLSFIKNLIIRLEDPIKVEKILKEKQEKEWVSLPRTRWDSLTLSHGLPAGIVLFSFLDSIFPQEEWDKCVHAYILRLKEKIEVKGISNLSLFSGLSGICFAIHQASRGGSRYQTLLEKLDGYLLSSLQQEVLAPIEKKIHLGLPSRMNDYEVVSGATGIGTYFLSRGMEEPLKKILKLLVERTKKIRVGRHTIAGWYVPRHYQFIEIDKMNFPKGNFNLGMAHGMAGILSLLSLSYMQKICVAGQIEAIQLIARWLTEKKSVYQGELYWPDRVSFEEEISGEIKRENITFDAWCYGSGGVARSLYLAAEALEIFELQQIAVEGFEAIIRRRKIRWNLNTCSLCHGFSGIMLMTYLMARDTGLSHFTQAYTDMRDELLKHFKKDSSFGFLDLEPIHQNQFISNRSERVQEVEFIEVEKVGLLDGVSGIFLALLTIEKGGTSWAAPFLIDRSDV